MMYVICAAVIRKFHHFKNSLEFWKLDWYVLRFLSWFRAECMYVHINLNGVFFSVYVFYILLKSRFELLGNFYGGGVQYLLMKILWKLWIGKILEPIINITFYTLKFQYLKNQIVFLKIRAIVWSKNWVRGA